MGDWGKREGGRERGGLGKFLGSKRSGTRLLLIVCLWQDCVWDVAGITASSVSGKEAGVM